MKSLLITGCSALVLLLQSCGPTVDEQDQLQYALIQGDWVSDDDDLDEESKLVFSFSDLLCSAYDPESPPFPFRIRNNVLFVCRQTGSFMQQRSCLLYAFTIEQLDEEHLVLHPTKETLTRRPKGQYLPLELDRTIALRRVRPRTSMRADSFVTRRSFSGPALFHPFLFVCYLFRFSFGNALLPNPSIEESDFDVSQLYNAQSFEFPPPRFPE